MSCLLAFAYLLCLRAFAYTVTLGSGDIAEPHAIQSLRQMALV